MKIDKSKLDYEQVAARVKAYRLVHGLTHQDLAERAGVGPGTIARIESGQKYSSMNQYWSIINAEKISVSWFFYGEGKWNDDCPENLPETIIRQRGAGLRRQQDRTAAETGQYAGDPFEFILAVESFKKRNNKPFPTWTEVFELVLSLGYRKVEKPTIYPYNAMDKSNDRTKSEPHTSSPVLETALVGSGAC